LADEKIVFLLNSLVTDDEEDTLLTLSAFFEPVLFDPRIGQ
jgi:hypothetical protein